MFQTSEMISSPSAAAVLGPAKDHPDPHSCLGTLFLQGSIGGYRQAGREPRGLHPTGEGICYWSGTSMTYF